MCADANRSYRCVRCGGIYVSDWSQEEADAEVRKVFGDVPPDQCVTVCDPCYEVLLVIFKPQLMREKAWLN